LGSERTADAAVGSGEHAPDYRKVVLEIRDRDPVEKRASEDAPVGGFLGGTECAAEELSQRFAGVVGTDGLNDLFRELRHGRLEQAVFGAEVSVYEPMVYPSACGEFTDRDVVWPTFGEELGARLNEGLADGCFSAGFVHSLESNRNRSPGERARLVLAARRRK